MLLALIASARRIARHSATLGLSLLCYLYPKCCYVRPVNILPLLKGDDGSDGFAPNDAYPRYGCHKILQILPSLKSNIHKNHPWCSAHYPLNFMGASQSESEQVASRERFWLLAAWSSFAWSGSSPCAQNVAYLGLTGKRIDFYRSVCIISRLPVIPVSQLLAHSLTDALGRFAYGKNRPRAIMTNEPAIPLAYEGPVLDHQRHACADFVQRRPHGLLLLRRKQDLEQGRASFQRGEKGEVFVSFEKKPEESHVRRGHAHEQLPAALWRGGARTRHHTAQAAQRARMTRPMPTAMVMK